MNLSVILLAAGEAKRMNGEKIRYRPEGKETMLEKVLYIVNNMKRFDSIELNKILVTNDLQESFVREKAANWQVFLNPLYKTGMASSIVTGIKKAIELNSEAVVLMLADMPFITVEDVEAVIETYIRCKKSCGEGYKLIVRPCYENIPGFPVLFGAAYFEAMLALKGDVGAKSIIMGNKEHLVKIISDNKGCTIDIDSIEK